MTRHSGNEGGRSGAGMVWRLMVCLAGLLVVTATPAAAFHRDDDGACHFIDSDFAEVEDGPVDTDTDMPGFTVCESAGSGGFPTSGRGAGDVGAGAGDIVPAARIDAGGGGTAIGGNPAGILGVLTSATAAIGAIAVRRRR